MFRALPAGSCIEATPNRIVSLQRCLNSSPIALGGGPSVQSRAHIVGVYNENGSYTVFSVLTPVAGGTGVLFCCDPRQVNLAAYRNVEREALDLVEGQGFVMEGVELKHLAPDEVTQVLGQLPIVTPQPSTASGAFERANIQSGGYASMPPGRRGQQTGGASGSRSGLYNLGDAHRGRTHAYSRPGLSGLHNQDMGSGVHPTDLRSPTGAIPRGHTQTYGTPRSRASGSGSGIQRINTGSISGLGQRGPRHGSTRTFGTTPGTPVPMADFGLTPEETIAVLGKMLALF